MRTTSGHGWWGVAALMLAGSTLLRVPGLWTDLWLDELWSLQAALAAESWRDLLLYTRVDNNHHLNSLYLYVVAPQSNPAVYRLLAFVSEVGTVATAWVIGARDSRLTAALAALLFGTSYMMVFYASEACGYATVVWLTLAAWYCVQRYADTPRWEWAVGFTLCSVLGIMAHPTFLLFFFGAYISCDAHLQRTLPSLRLATRVTRRLFVAPTIVMGMFYLVAIVGQEILGGPPYRLVTVVAGTLSAISGGPQAGPGVWIVAAVVATVFVLSTWSCYRSGDDRWLLYAAAGFIIPAIVVLLRQPPTLAPRYFIVPVTVLLVAASHRLARAFAHGGAARCAAVALVAAHVIGGRAGNDE